MGIGSFLAGAGQIGATAEDFVNKREVQRAQRAEAQARQLDLARREQSRQQAGLKSMSDYVGAAPTYDNFSTPMDVAEGDFGTKPAAPPPPPAAGVKPPAASVKPPAAAVTQKRMFAGVEVPYYDKNAPERLGVDPNASDVSKFFLRSSAMNDVKNRMNRIVTKVSEPFGDFRRPFMAQDRKAESDMNQRVAQWMQSDNARNYFARNPEMLDVAEKDPTGFFKALMNDPRPKKTAAPKAAAPKAAATAAPKAAASRTATEIALDTNPGALKDGDYARSQPGYTGSSGKFATFATPEQGIAAQENLLRNNYLNQGFVTVDSIIDKYTPAGKENPEANRNNYKNYVAGKLGVTRSTQIGEGQLPTLAQAMREFETGRRGTSSSASAGQTQTQPAGVDQTGGAQEPPRRMAPSEFYLNNKNPGMISAGTSTALQSRKRLEAIADRYRQEGRLDEFDAVLMQIDAQDANLRMLQGMQGITELTYSRNPSRLAAVWSDYAGTPIQIQPRTDGKYNVLSGGKVIAPGVDQQTLIDQARMTFDQAYLQQRTENQNAMMLKRFELQFGMDKDMAIEAMKSVSAANVAMINGKAEVAKQQIANLRRIMLQSPGGGAWVAEGNNISKLVDEYRPPGAPESVPAGPAMIRVDAGVG